MYVAHSLYNGVFPSNYPPTQLKDLRHDNICAFIGACTEPPNICIITEYCSRGSLKDVLENEDVKLDNMFLASMVADVIRVGH